MGLTRVVRLPVRSGSFGGSWDLVTGVITQVTLLKNVVTPATVLITLLLFCMNLQVHSKRQP